jgi:hypothetical protein
VGGKWLDDKSCCRHAELASSGPDFFSFFYPRWIFVTPWILHVGFFLWCFGKNDEQCASPNNFSFTYIYWHPRKLFIADNQFFFNYFSELLSRFCTLEDRPLMKRTIKMRCQGMQVFMGLILF